MPNRHGGDIYNAAALLGCPPQQITDFSSNINTVRPRVGLSVKAGAFAPYADPGYSVLREAIAGRYEIERSQIALFNGASAAIFELLRALSPQELFLYAPLYSEYKQAASLFAKEIRLVNRFDDLYEVPTKGSTVVFVNPSTPDGLCYDLQRLFSIWEAQECTVILDESFLEFTSRPSMRSRLKSDSKLYIIHSFTKYYGFAGMRIGALFSAPENLLPLKFPAWNLSSFDVKVLGEALREPNHQKRTREAQERDYATLLAMLTQAPFTQKVYPGCANFLLVQTREPASRIAETLLEQKILVRDCSNFDFLGGNHLRFAVKKAKSLKKLRKGLDALA